MATPVTLVGATGLTGSAALAALLASPTSFSVTALTRRPAAGTPSGSSGTTYTDRVVPDLAAAAADLNGSPIAQKGGVYVSCLGATRAAAGSQKEQENIDLHLNSALADRARADGAETLILVSAMGANSGSWLAYPRMKGRLEDHVRSLRFPNTVIIRPGVLLHEAPRDKQGWDESLVVGLVKGMKAWGLPTTSLGVHIDQMGEAIAQLAAHPPHGAHVLYNADVERLAAEYRASRAP